ncbi:MAG TPA: hypothetical protein VFS16_03065 [Acidimicrobiia bacterium]|nr:hypothetical protein [Acidimicrobiia bacterium]
MESGPETSSVIGDVIHDVVLADGEVVEVFGANAYVQEGPLTTFFHSGRSRAAIDSWAERVASFKTTEIRRIIRRHPPTLRAVPVDGAERAFGTSAG